MEGFKFNGTTKRFFRHEGQEIDYSFMSDERDTTRANGREMRFGERGERRENKEQDLCSSPMTHVPRILKGR